MRGSARRTLTAAAREPLLHFALLGLVLCGLYRAVGPTAPAREIVISAEVVHGLREDHRRRNGVPPSAEEEAGLVQRYVDNEMLYREALALGLDRGDIIVRRRLIQKMEFLAEGLAGLSEPTDAQLAEYVREHADTYRIPNRISFVHVFTRSDGDSATALARAHERRAALLSGAAADSVGDPFLRGAEVKALSPAEVAAAFGDQLAAAVFNLSDNSWSEPLPSAYGFHVVKITGREAARTPDLAEIRDTVARAWATAQQESATQAELQRLRLRYAVRRTATAPSVN